MKKQKLQLDELRLDSFVTSQIRGGMKRFEQLRDVAIDDTTPPSSDCDPTEASYTCPIG